MYLSLNGKWTFKQSDGSEWLPANVPSTNYTDLLALGKIPDPFVGLNEEKVLWVGEKDWIYRKEFDVPAEINSCPRIELDAKMLDTIFEARLNGKLIGKGQNCHMTYTFDIKSAIVKGKNVLEILFFAPVTYIRETAKTVQCFHNNNGLDGDTLMRKPQCHFGWDWGPTLPTSGIPKDIGIYYGDKLKVEDFRINQRHEQGKVTLDIKAEISGFDAPKEYVIEVTTPRGEVIEKQGKTDSASIDDTLEIINPELWWTHDISGLMKQPLYLVKTKLKNTLYHVESSLRIGLRTLVLERVPDEYGISFRFILNGVPTFAKGANWIPADSFEDRVTKERLTYLIGSAQFSGMNMLRVWGGGNYGSDDFYNLCDEMGIMVWQDCGFACQAYPLHENYYIELCKEEIENVVKRVRSHPSLALWCGNNEVEHSNEWWQYVPKMKLYLDSAERFFWHDLKDLIAKYDENTSYIPGSPTGSAFMKEFADDSTGDTHLWQVWHGMQNPKYYRMRYTRFCSEFGFESLPDIKTIDKFAGGEHYDLDSKVFNAHQKCRIGNKKMVYYIRNRFRSPKKFEDFVYLSQLCQMECVRDATEFWRRNRHRCNGSLFWQINDCWPVCSWASIDYYGNFKALQYAARHFNAPLSVSIADEKDKISFFTVNDTLSDIKCTLYYAFVDFIEGVKEEKTIDITANRLSASSHADVDMDYVRKTYDLKRTVVLAELRHENGAVLNRKTCVFDVEKRLYLPNPETSLKIERKNDTLFLTVKAQRFARLLRLHNSKLTVPFSDNWFDLMPGESKVVTFPYYSGVKANDFSMISAGEVVPACPEIIDDIKRLAFLLRPENLTVYLANYRRK